MEVLDLEQLLYFKAVNMTIKLPLAYTDWIFNQVSNTSVLTIMQPDRGREIKQW